MNETLIIENFVGIRNLKIQLKQINILIGPQATGKSIVAKLLFYFKNFVWELFSTVENEQTKRDLDNRVLGKFEEYFPPDSWGKGKFTIRYEMQNVFIEVTREDENSPKVSLDYSDYFKKELTNLRSSFKKLVEQRPDDQDYDAFKEILKVRRIFMRNISQQLDDLSTYSQLFIPAGRSFFANLQSSIFSFLSSNNAIDPFLREFGAFYESIKRFPGAWPKYPNEKINRNQIESLVESILCGRYENEKGQDYLIISDGRKIKVANSSSGQQEVLPLAIILSTLAFTFSGRRTIYIEEPEAHLFPTAQRDIIDLIANVFNVSKDPLQFLITTHSPYILTAANNLIHAGRLYKELTDKKKLEQLENIVPRERMLIPENIAVYSLGYETCENISCSETGLIETNVIDEVSDHLAIQFDNLLDIE